MEEGAALHGLIEVNPPRRFETQEAHQERVQAMRRSLWVAGVGFQKVLREELVGELLRAAYVAVGEALAPSRPCVPKM